MTFFTRGHGQGRGKDDFQNRVVADSARLPTATRPENRGGAIEIEGRSEKGLGYFNISFSTVQKWDLKFLY